MDILDEIFKPLDLVEVWEFYKPDVARKKVLEALDSASGALGDVSTSLEFAEFFANSEIAGKSSVYREHIDKFAKGLSLPGTLIKNFQSARKITQAVSGLRGKISDDPQAAAIAFGKLFSGIGELASYLPFPGARAFVEIFAGAEHFFENIRVISQPEIHMYEPGLRETIDNL